MLVLGIETSCDETAAAVIDWSGPAKPPRVLSNVVATQDHLHGPYGGVIPEVASRRHLEVTAPVVRSALTEAGVELGDLDGLAATRGPGLMGSLLVGLNLAKGLSLTSGLPLVGVDHLEAHIFSVFLHATPGFPFVALVVSGGHTNLYEVTGFGHCRLLGATRDDAAGEAFDKVAKLYGLGYPGGKVIETLAAEGDPGAIVFPRPMLGSGDLDFSFSGLKTAVVNFKRQNGDQAEKRDVAACFQAAVVDVLVQKTLAAVEFTGAAEVVLAGGVAANGALRDSMRQTGQERGASVHVPPRAFCTDNGAMVALTGAYRLERGERLPSDADAYSRPVRAEVTGGGG